MTTSSLTTQLHRTIGTWEEFAARWDGLQNFLMEGECVPFDYEMPSIDRVVDVVRHDPDANVSSGSKGDSLTASEGAERFRQLPLDEALQGQFGLAHYKLKNFDGPGLLLEGFHEQVLEPWKKGLAQAGFTWDRCYPILFASGAGSATNYHLDYSHVLAWQVHGTKYFSGLKDPEKWVSLYERIHHPGIKKPQGITADDALTYEMTPGTVLWNCFLTPHWVESGNEASYSINISHGGLRLDGKLCPYEQDLEQWRLDHPEESQIGVVLQPA